MTKSVENGGGQIGSHTVLVDVGETLLNILQENISGDYISQPDLIGLASPMETGDLMLVLYLYQINESEQRATQMIPNGSSTMRYPPMSVQLSYLVTAYSPVHLQERAKDEARILGRAMQVLNDHTIIRGRQLKGTLFDNNEELRLTMNNLNAEEMLKIWSFPSVPYKLSVSYSVGPVNIDSQRTKDVTRITEKSITIQG